jgi:hypothetical protein
VTRLRPRLDARLAGWAALVLVSALAWFETGRGLAFRLGLDGAEAGVGVAVAGVVTLTLVRWAWSDAEAHALAALECPRCRAALATHHEHGTRAVPGRQLWSCAGCGFERMTRLTCNGCAA